MSFLSVCICFKNNLSIGSVIFNSIQKTELNYEWVKPQSLINSAEIMTTQLSFNYVIYCCPVHQRSPSSDRINHIYWRPVQTPASQPSNVSGWSPMIRPHIDEDDADDTRGGLWSELVACADRQTDGRTDGRWSMGAMQLIQSSSWPVSVRLSVTSKSVGSSTFCRPMSGHWNCTEDISVIISKSRGIAYNEIFPIGLCWTAARKQ